MIRDDAIKLLDLSHNKLRNLSGKAHFERFGLLTALNLNDNQIKSFDDTTFQGLKSLLTLDLSSHEIIEIHGEPFTHLSSLLTLDLHSTYCTKLFQEPLTIATSAFTGLFDLERLDLHCNMIGYLPANIFADLKKLRYLDISSNFLQNIWAEFPASLQTLNLSRSYSIDFASRIHHDNVKNLQNLLELSSSFDCVRLFVKGGYRDIPESFKSLVRLNLYFLCRDLDLTYVDLLDSPLDHLSLSSFSCQTFHSSTFQPFAKWNVSLTHLEISNSKLCATDSLKEIEDYTFSLFTNLQKLTISKHHLSNLADDAFNGLTKLQELDLSNNQLSVIPQHVFDVFTNGNLKYLDLSNNFLEIFSFELETFFQVLSLEQVKFGNNQIICHLHCVVEECDNHLQNLTVVDMENIIPVLYYYDTVGVCHISLKSPFLVKLQLARNKGKTDKIYLLPFSGWTARSWRNPDYYCPLNLQYADLNNWFLSNSVYHYFCSTSNLTYLDISCTNLYDHNQSAVSCPYLKTLKLARNIINSSQEIAFIRAPSLTTLDLRHNLITNIQSEYVAMLCNLINLNLEDNRLQSLNWFQDLNKLQQINIAQNFLPAIPKTFLAQIKALQVLDASGNTYDCSHFTKCSLEPFQSWILQDTFTFISPNQMYHCISNSVSITSVNLEYCKYSVPIYICASFGGLFLMAIIIFLLVKYHWHIRYKLFLLLHRRHYRRPRDDERDDEEPDEHAQEMRPLAPIHYRRYDCYVAYAHQNEDWVNDELVANIEDYGPEPFSLCMKERGDIPPGRFLLSSICHGIMHSRRTLVVLSEHFMADGMCDFQLHIAQNRLIKEGRDVLILVVLDDIPDTKKTLLLRQILCTNKTVLRWPQDPLGKDLFWRRLREELKRPVRIDRRFEA